MADDGTTLPAENLLKHETSPYLRQHEDNPVHWRSWSGEALAEARATGKPVLLSVGYAACHWCHVMAHESFENEAIAAQMNKLFVNIKVDREERPDIDSIYQSALSMMGEHGGWPLTMFLTPDGEPFWGGTYFPPEPRFGRPSFPQVLEQISAIYAEDPEKVRTNADALKGGLEQMAAQGRAGEALLSISRADEVAAAALQIIDPEDGGTRGAPKFPQPTLFRFIWQATERRDQPLLEKAVTLTLDNLCQGGIYDHLGGGFARYSTDAEWLVPHFEKMLYDNALLIELLSDVWLRNRKPLYAARVRETIDWMLRELAVSTDHGTAFASAYDADSEGVEGKFYVWVENEIDTVLGDAGLGDQADAFRKTYRTAPHGNWEGANILNRAADDPGDGSDFVDARKALFAVRKNRIWPGRDDKVLTDWNGLAIAALARAGQVFDEPDWIAAAESTFAFIQGEMIRGDRLLHSWCGGEARHAAVLDDYANMARGALMLHAATGKADYLAAAETWASIATAHHRDPEGGAYFLAADDTADLVVRTKVLFDNATPSGNGILAEVFARLWLLTGKDEHRGEAETILRGLTPEDPRALLNQPGAASAAVLLEDGLQIVIVGPDDDNMAATAARAAPSLSVLNRIADPASLPENHPASGKGLVDGKTAAYLCRGPVCGLPIIEADELEKALATRATDA